MTYEQVLLLLLFTAAAAGSPGPANTLFLASGAAYGWRATLPFIGGTLVGFIFVGLLIGAGLSALLQEYKPVAAILAGLSAVYILYLAYRIATADPQAQNITQRFRFRDGVIIHPLNPKAWLMLTAAFAQFASSSDQNLVQILTVLSAFILLGGSLNVLWAVGGQVMTSRLKRPETLRTVNRAMAIMLALIVLTMLASRLPSAPPGAEPRPIEAPIAIAYAMTGTSAFVN